MLFSPFHFIAVVQCWWCITHQGRRRLLLCPTHSQQCHGPAANCWGRWYKSPSIDAATPHLVALQGHTQWRLPWQRCSSSSLFSQQWEWTNFQSMLKYTVLTLICAFLSMLSQSVSFDHNRTSWIEYAVNSNRSTLSTLSHKIRQNQRTFKVS